MMDKHRCACTNLESLLYLYALIPTFDSLLWGLLKTFQGNGKSQTEIEILGGSGEVGAPQKNTHHSECHRLMITNSAGIPEGGLLFKKLMLPDACLGTIKDVSPKLI